MVFLTAIDFLDLIPTFEQGTHKLHDVLLPVSLVVTFAGLTHKIVQAQREQSIGSLMPLFVRLAMIVILVTQLGIWGDMVNSAVEDVNNQTGFNQGNVLKSYQDAIATKFSKQNKDKNPFSWLFGSPKQVGVGAAILGALVSLLLLVALALMWLVTGIQQILYYCYVAFSPLFIGCIMVPALISLASRFFTSFIGIFLWPLARSICDLVTKALIDFAVRPSSNVPLETTNATITGMVWWVTLAIWVILSSILGPWIIMKAVMTGSSSVTIILGGVVGAGAFFGRTVASTAGAAAPVAPATSVSIASSTTMTPYRNFATRPMNEDKHV